MGVGPVHNLEELDAILGCGIQAMPGSYLGLPLRAKYKSKQIWDPMIEKV